MKFLLLIGLAFWFADLRSMAANTYSYDVCVYGGTSGGAMAALSAARLGKKACLLLQNNHVGGMTSGGLGVTDVGSWPASIGGFTAEFYSRVGQYYGSTNPVYWFEPHVAEQTFLQMLNRAGVNLYSNAFLASVTMTNQTITQIVLPDGTAFAAREFIDTTYEGDLMALAGVSCTWGREGTNVYGESLAGVTVNSTAYPCNAYVVSGNTNSGLLPYIQPGLPGTNGQGDSRIQCYNFRLCLTQVATNQIPITAPLNYAETNYELMHRYILAYVATNGSVPLNRLIDVQQLIPNGKTDINAYADFSTDFVGNNYTYPTNTYAARQQIYLAHKYYEQGLLYYLGNSLNVPLNVRTNMLSWGYAKDEFTDNGGWPYPLYVREARRMISDYVMQQADALGGRQATDSVALANYTLDCHPDARLAVNGISTTEGGIGVSIPAPYPISYRSLVPAVGQCSNLFCTFALSASHVGFASLRLEPVFMMTSQAAGTAAAFAIDDGVPVQKVNYAKLSAQLLADGQMLAWTNSSPGPGIVVSVTNATGVTSSGTWTTGSNPGGWPLPSGPYWVDGLHNGLNDYVTFTPTLPSNGVYGVYLWWVASSPPYRNTRVEVDTRVPGGVITNYVNQQQNGSVWNLLLTTNFTAGTQASVTIRDTGNTNYVIANAVEFVPLPTPGSVAPPVELLASAAQVGEWSTNLARFTVVLPSGTNHPALTVNYSVGGTAVPGQDYAALPGSVTLPPGVLSTNLYVVPLGNTLNSDTATVSLNLLASTNYALTNLSAATVTLADRPLNIWLRANFTPTQLTNPAVSGDAATPANDGVPNLVKYALGLTPLTAAAPPLNPSLSSGQVQFTWTQSLAATDVALGLAWSPDLLVWSPATNRWTTTLLNLNRTNESFSLQPSLTNTNPAGFLRFYANRLAHP